MKASFGFALFLFSLAEAQAQPIPEATLNNLQKLYPNQNRAFIEERLKNAPLPFNKWRSFPPYYYQMMDRIPEGNELRSRPGLCAGDPHLENFGFIYGNPPVFTLNDMDDVTPCSLDMDLMRLFVGHRMIRPELKATDFLSSYQNGLSGASCPQPAFIKKLEESSLKKGQELSKKNKALRDSNVCTGEYQTLTPEEKLMIDDFNKVENGDKSCVESSILSDELKKLVQSVSQTDPKLIVHACARVKESGGSAGGRRLVVFRKWSSGEDAFELKPLAKPAPHYNVNIPDSQRQKVYEKAIETYMGPEKGQHYYPVSLTHPKTKVTTLYQRRPLWGGNEEIKDEDLVKAGQDKQEIMLYETCRIGALHARSQQQALSIRPQDWERIATSIEQQFKKEFGH